MLTLTKDGKVKKTDSEPLIEALKAQGWAEEKKNEKKSK